MEILVNKNVESKLEKLVCEYNLDCKNETKSEKKKKPKLILDVAVYLVYFISEKLLTSNREKEFDENTIKEGVQLNSNKELRIIHKKYPTYIEFLAQNDIIRFAGNHSTDNKKCRTYTVNPKYLLGVDCIIYTISYRYLLEKLDMNGNLKFNEVNKRFCEYFRPHLTKFFNNHLTVDYDEASREIIENTEGKNELAIESANHQLYQFNKRRFHYSINVKTDFRFHSSTSLICKMVRRHAMYKGVYLLGIDIKTSQPYFFCSVLKAILLKDKEILKQIGALRLIDEELLYKLFYEIDIDKDDVINFVNDVLNKDFYNEFSSKIDVEYDGRTSLPFRDSYKEKPKNKRGLEGYKSHKRKVYKNKRDLSKDVLMEVFYGSENNHNKYVKAFKNEYPSVKLVIDTIKEHGLEFWKLLQQIEAHCILDVTAKKINQEFPELYLCSGHDNLITTETEAELVYGLMQKYIQEVTTLKVMPKLEYEYWGREPILYLSRVS